MVGVWLVGSDVANDICVDFYVRKKSQGGGMVLGAIYIMVYLCGIFKCNDCDIELENNPRLKTGGLD